MDLNYSSSRHLDSTGAELISMLTVQKVFSQSDNPVISLPKFRLSVRMSCGGHNKSEKTIQEQLFYTHLKHGLEFFDRMFHERRRKSKIFINMF